MRRRLNPLRRLDPRTTPEGDPDPDTTPDAPVAWAQEPTGKDATEPGAAEPAAPEDPATTVLPVTESEPERTEAATDSSETTVLPVIDGEDAPQAPGDSAESDAPAAGQALDEPETALFAPVPPAPLQAPQDAAAAPPLEVLAVQPDGTVLPAPDPDAPAGVEPGATHAGEPGFRVRGRLRRRLRYLRRVRELGLRDLGGLVFDLHRFQREGEALVAGKLTALDAVDREVRELEESLDDRRELVVLREPGLAACPRCAALHGSDANFCPSCGLPFSGGTPATGPGAAPIGSTPPPYTPGPSSVTATHGRVVDGHGAAPGPV